MNQREARRLITQRVAVAVRGIDDFDAYGPDDRRRLCRARDLLAHELETRCGGTGMDHPRDPDQIAIDYEEGTL